MSQKWDQGQAGQSAAPRPSWRPGTERGHRACQEETELGREPGLGVCGEHKGQSFLKSFLFHIFNFHPGEIHPTADSSKWTVQWPLARVPVVQPPLCPGPNLGIAPGLRARLVSPTPGTLCRASGCAGLNGGPQKGVFTS